MEAIDTIRDALDFLTDGSFGTAASFDGVFVCRTSLAPSVLCLPLEGLIWYHSRAGPILGTSANALIGLLELASSAPFAGPVCSMIKFILAGLRDVSKNRKNCITLARFVVWVSEELAATCKSSVNLGRLCKALAFDPEKKEVSPLLQELLVRWNPTRPRQICHYMTHTDLHIASCLQEALQGAYDLISSFREKSFLRKICATCSDQEAFSDVEKDLQTVVSRVVLRMTLNPPLSAYEETCRAARAKILELGGCDSVALSLERIQQTGRLAELTEALRGSMDPMQVGRLVLNGIRPRKTRRFFAASIRSMSSVLHVQEVADARIRSLEDQVVGIKRSLALKLPEALNPRLKEWWSENVGRSEVSLAVLLPLLRASAPPDLATLQHVHGDPRPVPLDEFFDKVLGSYLDLDGDGEVSAAEFHAFTLEVDSWRCDPLHLTLPPLAEIGIADCLRAGRQGYNRALLDGAVLQCKKELDDLLKPVGELHSNSWTPRVATLSPSPLCRLYRRKQHPEGPVCRGDEALGVCGSG